MPILDDLSIAENGDIRWTGGASTYYTVLELHEHLADLADNAESTPDDLLDITSPTPSVRVNDNIIQLINGYNIDDTCAQHFYDGSIEQAGGDTLYAGIQVNGTVFDANTEIQCVQNNAVLTSWWSTGINTDTNILLRTMVKVRDAGSDVDGKRLRFHIRELGQSFEEAEVTCTTGINSVSLTASEDSDNSTLAATIAGWTSIVNISEGYQTIDLNNGNGARPYYSQWDLGTQSKNDLYERSKWLTRRGTSETLYGMNGELFRGITHSFDYFNESGGPWTQNEVLTFSGGATAALLAVDDQGTTGTMYIQLLTGTAPANGESITGGTSAATATVNSALVTRTLGDSFMASSSGTALTGAYGVGIQAADITWTDTLTDLSGTTQTPPHNVVFEVNNLVVGEDRLIVTNDNTSDIDYTQLSAAAGNSVGAGTMVVKEAIPSDTPVSGTIRVYNGSRYERVEYSSWSGSTFTLTGTLPSTISEDANVFISYIDKLAASTTESFTVIYDADRTMFVRVRDGGATRIVTYEATGVMGTGGGSVNAVRTDDEA